MSQGLNALLQFEMPQILLDDIRHSHPQCRRKILRCHRHLLVEIVQQIEKAIRQTGSIAWWIEVNRQFFALAHLPKISQISANDWNSKGTRQVGNSTASGGGRVWHDRDSSTLK